MSSALRQLLEGQEQPWEKVSQIYHQRKRGSSEPSFQEVSFQEVSQMLESVIVSYSRAVIVIDALDECWNCKEDWDLYLSKILHISKTLGVQLFTTSRPIPDITQKFAGELSIAIRASDEDVLKYINNRMPRLLRNRIVCHPDLQDLVRKEVLTAVDGM
jgi:hypothetical protein